MTLQWKQMIPALIAFLLPTSTLLAEPGEPVAMLTEVQGEVLLEGGQAEVFAELGAGASLELQKGSTVTLVLVHEGDEFTLTGPVKVTVQSDGVFSDGKRLEGIGLIESAGIDLDLGDMAQAAIVMRGKLDKNQRPILEHPVDTNILAPHPTFRWLPVGPGFQYQFTLSNPAGQVIYQDSTSRAFVDLPTEISLPRDVSLTWALSATHPSNPDETFNATAKFMLLPEAIARQVNAKRPAQDADKSARLRYAKFLESLNLKADAERYLKDMAKR